MVICEAGTSNRGAIRSSSTVILPRAPEEPLYVADAFGGEENLRAATRALMFTFLEEHLRQRPPMRVNMVF